jgi:hypothetical protein
VSKRHYSVLFGRHGGFMNWPGASWGSNVSIRAFAASVFRQWFGRNPDGLCWHVKGQMASCHDRRGNYIEVEQVNKQRCPQCGRVDWPDAFSKKYLGVQLDRRCLRCAAQPTLALPWHASTGGAS